MSGLVIKLAVAWVLGSILGKVIAMAWSNYFCSRHWWRRSTWLATYKDGGDTFHLCTECGNEDGWFMDKLRGDGRMRRYR